MDYPTYSGIIQNFGKQNPIVLRFDSAEDLEEFIADGLKFFAWPEGPEGGLHQRPGPEEEVELIVILKRYKE